MHVLIFCQPLVGVKTSGEELGSLHLLSPQPQLFFSKSQILIQPNGALYHERRKDFGIIYNLFREIHILVNGIVYINSRDFTIYTRFYLNQFLVPQLPSIYKWTPFTLQIAYIPAISINCLTIPFRNPN